MADSSGGLESMASGTLKKQNAQDGLSEVLAALKIVHDPSSSNSARQEASFRLDDAKRAPQAPAQGFEIASNTSNDDTLRHFGLSMVEYYIKYVWDGRSDAEVVLRDYVVQLARDIRPQDPPYIRNKVAQLWTELAKRSWGDQWMNMDEILVKILPMSITHQLLVLTILETLVEQVFNREDPAAGVRGGDLGTACNEIFTPESVLKEVQSSPEEKPSRLRYGSEGWLHRLCVFLNQSLVNNSLGNPQIHGVILKTLTTIRATISWINIKAISAVHVPTTLIQALANGDTAMRTASVEAMIILFSRGKSFDDADFDHIVNPMYNAQNVALLYDAYRWAVVDAHDIDEEKYEFLKKLAEMISHLGHLLALKPLRIHMKDSPDPADIANLYSLFITVTSNPSMSVSIHCLELWAHFVRYNKPWSTTEAEHYNSLLEICRQRLVRYEVLPEGFQDDTWLFLQEDFDTIAERHTFVGNYRKYCVEIVHQMIPRYPLAVTIHLLDEAKSLIGNLNPIGSDFNGLFDRRFSFEQSLKNFRSASILKIFHACNPCRCSPHSR
jgi:exportin-5